jgi:hypothetical protein
MVYVQNKSITIYKTVENYVHDYDLKEDFFSQKNYRRNKFNTCIFHQGRVRDEKDSQQEKGISLRRVLVAHACNPNSWKG